MYKHINIQSHPKHEKMYIHVNGNFTVRWPKRRKDTHKTNKSCIHTTHLHIDLPHAHSLVPAPACNDFPVT